MYILSILLKGLSQIFHGPRLIKHTLQSTIRTPGLPCESYSIMCLFIFPAGVKWDDPNSIEFAKQIQAAGDAVRLEGLYCVDGVTYAARGQDQLRSMSNTTAERFIDFKNR